MPWVDWKLTRKHSNGTGIGRVANSQMLSNQHAEKELGFAVEPPVKKKTDKKEGVATSNELFRLVEIHSQLDEVIKESRCFRRQKQA